MLSEILEPQISLFQPICREEADDLCKQLEVAQLATDRFIKGEVSYSDFLELMELAGVDIDNYALTVESNLSEIGVTI